MTLHTCQCHFTHEHAMTMLMNAYSTFEMVCLVRGGTLTDTMVMP